MRANELFIFSGVNENIMVDMINCNTFTLYQDKNRFLNVQIKKVDKDYILSYDYITDEFSVTQKDSLPIVPSQITGVIHALVSDVFLN